MTIFTDPIFVFIISSMNRNELPTQDSNHLLIPSSAGHLNALLTPGADGTAVSLKYNENGQTIEYSLISITFTER